MVWVHKLGECNKTIWGQRQRLGIAKVLFHNKDILIFDEATNAWIKTLKKKFLTSFILLRAQKQ